MGQPFALGALDTDFSPEIAPADLIVISHRVNHNLKDFNGIIERLMGLAKPDAIVLITAPAASNNKEIALPALRPKGFQLLSFIPLGAECLALYSSGATEKQEPEKKLVNGYHKEELVILERSTSSVEAQSFSQKLKMVLQDQGYSVTANPGLADTIEGKTYISLLELEQPVLDNLSEPEFQRIGTLVLNCGRLLWITCGDNPLLGMVDGFLRVV